MIPVLPSFALLTRLGSLPVEPLVEALRDLHTRGATDSMQLQALLAPPPSDPPPDPAKPLPPRGVNYETARKHFADHAQRLREQAILSERLLDGLVKRHGTKEETPIGVLLARELAIDCQRGGESVIRFVVVNSLDRAVTLRFRVGRPHGAFSQPLEDVVSFDPPAPRLEAGGQETVRLAVDLRGQPHTAGAFEFGVDVLGDERLLVKLWVRAQVVGQEVPGDIRATRS